MCFFFFLKQISKASLPVHSFTQECFESFLAPGPCANPGLTEDEEDQGPAFVEVISQGRQDTAQNVVKTRAELDTNAALQFYLFKGNDEPMN